MTEKTASGDLRSALRALFPDVAASADDHAQARKESAARFLARRAQAAQEGGPTRATGSRGRNAGGQALQIDRRADGSISPRGLDSVGRDWSVRVAAEAVAPTSDNHWKAPPPSEAPLPRSLPDLSGQVFGRLTVLRYHRSRRNGGALWLVRCVCGDYEARSTKKLRDATADQGCSECNHLENLRRADRENARRGRRGDAAVLFDKLAADVRRKPS